MKIWHVQYQLWIKPEHGITPKAEFETRVRANQIYNRRDGMIAAFEKMGLKYMNACGPCIDNGIEQVDKQEKNNCTFCLT
jgi:aconitase A